MGVEVFPLLPFLPLVARKNLPHVHPSLLSWVKKNMSFSSFFSPLVIDVNTKRGEKRSILPSVSPFSSSPENVQAWM